MRNVRTLKFLGPLSFMLVLSLSWNVAATAESETAAAVKTLAPTSNQTALDRTIAKLLSQYHYRQSKLDDGRASSTMRYPR